MFASPHRQRADAARPAAQGAVGDDGHAELAAPPAKGVPEVVAKTLDHVVGQLDAITSTLGALEKRICANEGRVQTILEKQ